MHRIAPALAVSLLAAAACGPAGEQATSGPGSTQGGGTIAPAPGAPLVEDFEQGPLPDAPLVAAPSPDDGPFGDDGAYFSRQGIVAPPAYRLSQPFGEGGWLTLESYSRRPDAKLSDFADVVVDPADPSNHALRIRSPDFTDATVVRPTRPLPPRYTISLRVGFPSFGDGVAPNGYSAPATPEPWLSGDAQRQNGFYWVAILDAQPRPHNNVWIHHHRKIVVDSDNHYPPWMQIWDGSEFLWSGVHPVMMIALDGTSPGPEASGNPFYSWSDGAWQPSGAIRAVDAYLPGEWYRASITRDGPTYTIELSGRFRYGGEQTYRATFDAAARCGWHYPATADEAAGASGCVDPSSYDTAPGFPQWPAGGVWPDWFVFGDPHENFYEGQVLYDDVRLEVPAG